MLEDDPGERYAAGVEDASGERPHGCPWRALQDPFVRHVTRAHRWFKSGELGTRFGGRVPYALAVGVEVYDAAVNAIGAHDRREDAEKRKREAMERELARAAQSMVGRAPVVTGARRRG